MKAEFIDGRFIIFLDVDGVLCSYAKNIYVRGSADEFAPDGEHYFMRSAIDALNTIIDYYDADLCMISGWNSKFQNEAAYKSFLVGRGIHVNNLYIGDSHKRLDFILRAIADGLKHYLVIDDEAYKYYKNMDAIGYSRILRTGRNRCLDEDDAWLVTQNFKLNVT